MKIWTNLMKQYKVSGKIGGAKDILTRSLFYVSIINFVLIVATAYNTTLRDTLAIWFPWLNFPIFLVVLIVLLLIVMLIEYKVVIPSTWVFLNRQQFEHQNLIREQLDRVERTLSEIQEKQGEIKDDNQK